MKKILTILAISIIIFGCKKEKTEDCPECICKEKYHVKYSYDALIEYSSLGDIYISYSDENNNIVTNIIDWHENNEISFYKYSGDRVFISASLHFEYVSGLSSGTGSTIKLNTEIDFYDKDSVISNVWTDSPLDTNIYISIDKILD